jgi:hypothetical protein
LAERIDVTEPVEPGDVIEIDPAHPKRYRKARSPYSPLVAGVIATQPGITLANRPEELARLSDYLRRQAAPAVGMRVHLSSLLKLSLPRSSVGLRELAVAYPAPTATVSIAALLAEVERARVIERLGVRLPGRPLLALMGRVYVKATAENGPIRPGDLLTTAGSKPGYAMRCPAPEDCAGAIVGKALESLTTAEGLIEVLVVR